MADITTIMTADPAGAELVKFARDTAISLVRSDAKRSQIRNIFTEAREIQAAWKDDQLKAMRRLNLLKAKLAYQAERHKSIVLLKDVLSKAIDEVGRVPDSNREDSFQRFMDLFEAILAYHRAEGGKS